MVCVVSMYWSIKTQGFRNHFSGTPTSVCACRLSSQGSSMHEKMCFGNMFWSTSGHLCNETQRCRVAAVDLSKGQQRR